MQNHILTSLDNQNYLDMKTTLKLIALTAVLLIFVSIFTSCKEKEKPFLEVDETPITLPANPVYMTIPILVYSNGEWTATVQSPNGRIPDWLYLRGAYTNSPRVTVLSRINDGTVLVGGLNSVYLSPRVATVVFRLGNLTKEVPIIQEAYPALGDIPCPNDPCGCGIENPVENLPWLKDLIRKFKTDSTGVVQNIGIISLEKYRGQDIFIFTSVFFDVGVFYSDCAGNHCVANLVAPPCKLCDFLGHHHFFPEPRDFTAFIFRYFRSHLNPSSIIYSF